MRTPSDLIGMDPTGVTWFDLVVLDDPRYRNENRVAAVRVLAKQWYRRPIAPQRWNAIEASVLEALKNRASANGTTPPHELAKSVENSLHLAIDYADGIFAPGPRHAFHRKLNNLVVEDLLGPKWREKPTIDIGELEEVLEEQANQAEVEAKMELEARVASTNLSSDEEQIIWAIFHGETPGDIAVRLGKTPEATRKALSRARKKLRAEH